MDSLIRGLSAKDGETRLQSLAELKKLGDDAAPAVPALIKMLKEKEQPPRCNTHECYGTNNEIQPLIFEIFAQLGPKAKEALPITIEFFEANKYMRDGWQGNLRNYSLKVMASMGETAAPAVPMLMRYIEGFSPVDYAQALIEKRALPNSYSFREVFDTLAKIGHVASDAVPALIQHTKDRGNDVRDAAFQALSAIAPKDSRVLKTYKEELLKSESCCNTKLQELAVNYLRHYDSFGEQDLKILASYWMQEAEHCNSAMAYNPLHKPILMAFSVQKQYADLIMPAITKTIDCYPSSGGIADGMKGGLFDLIKTTGDFGSKAQLTVPSLRKKAIDEFFSHKGYREVALEALQKIGTPEALNAVKEAKAKFRLQ